MKILFDQLKGKNIVTRRNGGVRGKDRGLDIFLAGRGKILAR
jgi:hypothetical protein